MAADYDIVLATAADIPDILALQEQNLPHRGGTLSVALSHDWFAAALTDLSVIVARCDGRLVGYLASASFARVANVPHVKAQQRVYPAGEGAYNYGPVCVADSERGRGLAGRLFDRLRRQLPDREAITFIRRDNAASIQAHVKMGMREVAGFTHDGIDFVVVAHGP